MIKADVGEGRRAALIVFEGGYESGPEADSEEAVMVRLRRALTLDMLEKAAAADFIGPVIVATDQEGIAQEASRMGLEVVATARPDTASPAASPDAAPSGFHFGRSLAETAALFHLEEGPVITVGGAACPLAETDHFAGWARMLLDAPRPTVIVNNPMSPDITGFTPAGILKSIDLPETDNALAYTLRQGGLERVLLPLDPRLMFDLDTPADALILSVLADQVPAPGRPGPAPARGKTAPAGQVCAPAVEAAPPPGPGAGLGPRTRRILKDLPWDRRPLAAAMEVLKRPGSEILLAGRVGPSVVSFINEHLPLRVRVLSEERGMKALGRLEKGQVRSLLAHWLRDGDFRGFFAALADTCHAAFIDTRVLFAHGGRRVSDGDRWSSDVGRWRSITDPFVRDFTRAAAEAPLPVVLGGHTLVLGGVWSLAASAAASAAAPAASN